MWWPASSGRLAVVWIWSREACRSLDLGHGEQVAVGEVWRNVGGSREMVEGQEELVNPDITVVGPYVYPFPGMSQEMGFCRLCDSGSPGVLHPGNGAGREWPEQSGVLFSGNAQAGQPIINI